MLRRFRFMTNTHAIDCVTFEFGNEFLFGAYWFLVIEVLIKHLNVNAYTHLEASSGRNFIF